MNLLISGSTWNSKNALTRIISARFQKIQPGADRLDRIVVGAATAAGGEEVVIRVSMQSRGAQRVGVQALACRRAPYG